MRKPALSRDSARRIVKAGPNDTGEEGGSVMQSRGKDMTMTKWATIIIVLLTATALLAPIAHAVEEHAGRAVHHILKVETKEVGDVPGHVTGMNENSGLIFFTKGPSAGEIATTMGTNRFDVVDGKGTFTAERVNTYPDGSTLSLKVTGSQTPVDGGKRTAFEGFYEFTGGTGRYAEKEGKGTFKGERIGSPKTGGDAYFDFAGTEWKKK